ncbi:MAG TPA: DUF6249 domain-containing protein [Draconibacterium sp.]|nr:DUF6249 domain-containing protein [Draconibacterium sp.]
MESFGITLVWLGLFAAIFLAWYFYLKARNKERMALIESGKDVSEIYSKQKSTFRFPWLKLGVIMTGISFGFLLSFFVTTILFKNWPELRGYESATFIFGITFLFAAISIIIAYFIDKPKT